MDCLSQKGLSLKRFTGEKICRGVVSGLTDAFVIGEEVRKNIVSRNPDADQIMRPFLQGRQIRPYGTEPTAEHLIYTHHGIDMSPYPAVLEHLRPFRKRLESRATKQEWYELQQPQFVYVEYFEQPKIVFPDIATECRFALDENRRFPANTVYFIPTADEALLAVLNSRLALFFFKQTCAALEGPGGSYLRFFGQYLEGFPVVLPAQSRGEYRSLVDMGKRMEHLHRQLHGAKTGQDATVIRRQIDTTDRQVDQLVYDLYGLTDEDIRIVEGETC